MVELFWFIVDNRCKLDDLSVTWKSGKMTSPRKIWNLWTRFSRKIKADRNKAFLLLEINLKLTQHKDLKFDILLKLD